MLFSSMPMVLVEGVVGMVEGVACAGKVVRGDRAVRVRDEVSAIVAKRFLKVLSVVSFVMAGRMVRTVGLGDDGGGEVVDLGGLNWNAVVVEGDDGERRNAMSRSDGALGAMIGWWEWWCGTTWLGNNVMVME